MKFKQIITIALVLASAQSAFSATKCESKNRGGLFENTNPQSGVKAVSATNTAVR